MQYETEAMASLCPPCHPSRDRQYVERHSAWIRAEILDSICNRRAAAQRERNTGKLEILSPAEAGTALLVAIEHYYQVRSAPYDVHVMFQALRVALHDPAKCITALNDVILYFIRSEAVVQSSELREAVRVAQLSIKTLQATWATLPAVTEDSWR